jgi:prophage DNA circulation protein
MSKFDLNKPIDFGRVTQGADVLGGAASVAARGLQLFGSNPLEWQLDEASYKGILFNVFKSQTAWQAGMTEISDSGGRRKSKFLFPYTDGQTTDDLGRAPESFSCTAMFYGDNYLDGLSALLNVFQDPSPGDLVHPVRGVVRCVGESYSLRHSYDNRKSVMVELQFAEHNFDYSASFKESKSQNLFKSLLNKAAKFIAVFQRVTLAVRAAQGFANSIRSIAGDGVEAYAKTYALALSLTNVSFNKGSSRDLPMLLSVNEGGNLNSNGTQSGSTFQSAQSPSDPFASAQSQVSNTSVAGSIAVQKAINESRIAATLAIRQLSAMQAGVTQLSQPLTDSEGSLVFYFEIQQLKQSVIALQLAFESGVQSARVESVPYVTPRLMSIREVAFANGLDPDRSNEIDLLNPSLQSVNFIPEGVTLLVPQ